METIEWGVRHEGGKVTITPTGHAFMSRMSAEREAAKLDIGCEYCDGDQHEVVCQTVTYGGWKTPGPLPLRLPQRGE
jgi:hypothetical protein